MLFSTYSDRFWEHRLQWFRDQAKAGLFGEIDPEKTRDGVIVCKDGFKSSAVRPKEFLRAASKFDVKVQGVEVDDSSLFFEMTAPR